jgi:hypothetical protein
MEWSEGNLKIPRVCPHSSWLRKQTVRLPKSALIVGCRATLSAGHPELLGMKTGAIHVYFSYLEAMRADGQQFEQNLSHFLGLRLSTNRNVCDGAHKVGLHIHRRREASNTAKGRLSRRAGVGDLTPGRVR